MTPDNWLVLAILLGAILLFLTDKIRVDLVALMVLVTLVITGLLTPQEAFTGFASPAVITVWAVFIISGAVSKSGIADSLGQLMMYLSGENPVRLLFVIMLTSGVMSAFMNNIGAVAILLPAVVAIGRRYEVPASKLLIPLSFSALLGGNMTLIGTPPNILATTLLNGYENIDSFTFFDFLPSGLIILTGGILYMLLIGRHLLPERTSGKELTKEYPVREFLAEVLVESESPLVDKSMRSIRLGQTHQLNVLHAIRDGQTYTPAAEYTVQAGDTLLLEGRANDIVKGSVELNLRPIQDWTVENWAPESMQLSEIILSPRSRFSGTRLENIQMRGRYGLSVLAIRHAGSSIINQLGRIPVYFGDVLLVYGRKDGIELIRNDPNFLVLDSEPIVPRNTRKAPHTLAILLGTLLVATLGWLDIAIALLIGAILVVLVGVMTMDEAYRAIDWKAVFLIAGMLPMGLAMEQTGTARVLASQIIELIGGWGTLGVLAGIFLVTALLTEVISNAAATVLMVPIAIDTALRLGSSPQTFVMAVVIAASTSFLMPIGHQANIIIYGPGGYKFGDYARVGVGLNILLLILVLIFLPMIWGL